MKLEKTIAHLKKTGMWDRFKAAQKHAVYSLGSKYSDIPDRATKECFNALVKCEVMSDPELCKILSNETFTAAFDELSEHMLQELKYEERQQS